MKKKTNQRMMADLVDFNSLHDLTDGNMDVRTSKFEEFKTQQTTKGFWRGLFPTFGIKGKPNAQNVPINETTVDFDGMIEKHKDG